MADRTLKIPKGMNIDTLLFPVPEDAPLPSIAGFDTLKDTHNVSELEWLSQWADSQLVVNMILKHHGDKGLTRVLKGIAIACSEKQVHMTPRIASIAGFYNLQVY